ncbi:hypothetical protein IEQ11_01810 [Lysobacter capsici]|uniref:hypothetical protein n=1 Tax=Lysobacter capsici TaxID=435897 RepID=UPI001784645A|nr:hypothetical protein [Lysobacter capsici]UOF15427.1 hypothetical protein IEQ11_01810 [Lysobacter capsici]
MTGVALSPPTRPEGSPEPTRGCAQSGVWVAFPAAIVGVESPIFEAAARRARARWMNAQARYLRACRTGTLLDARSAKNQATTMAAIASASRFQALRAASDRTPSRDRDRLGSPGNKKNAGHMARRFDDIRTPRAAAY